MVNTLKFGVFLYQPEPVEGVDYNFYRLKSESGIVGKVNPKMYTNIAIFGDNFMAEKRPDWFPLPAKDQHYAPTHATTYAGTSYA